MVPVEAPSHPLPLRPSTVLAGLGLVGLLGLVSGCTEELPAPESPCSIYGQGGLWDGTLLNPFPSQHLVTTDSTSETSCRLAIALGLLPVGDSEPLGVARLNRLDGFSPVQSLWFQPRVEIDPTSLPSLDQLDASLAADTSIELWNLTSGQRIRHFAELDAYPTATPSSRALLIRPQEHMGFGQRIGVVVTNAVTQLDGSPLEASSSFEALWTGENAEGRDQALRSHYADLRRQLEELGVDASRVVLAWDFQTATESAIRAPLDRVIQAMRDSLPQEGNVSVDVEVSRFEDSEANGTPPPGLWREVRGSFLFPQFLWAEDGSDDANSDHDSGLFRLDEGGLPLLRDEAPAYFTLTVPESLKDAAAGSAPLLIFGHGLFSSPQDYIASTTDQSGVMDVCDRIGAVCLGGEWRGLTERDRPDILRVTGDLSRFPLVTDKLIQGVANQMALARLARTSFAGESFLQAADGSGSLIDPSRIYYYGISLGGVEGATLLANSEIVDRAVLHVPGSVWSQLLERSSNWLPLESFLLETLPDAASRQLIYSAIQLLFDPVDPIHYTEAITRHRSGGTPEKFGLWQVSVGDEQVMNFTADILARTADIPLVTPSPYAGAGDLRELVAPDETEGPVSGVFHFDPQKKLPSSDNRPAEITGAHDGIRTTEEVKAQTVAYLTEDGAIIHPCSGPCVLEVER